MKGQAAHAYWKFSACIVISLALSSVGYWTSGQSLTVEQWRGVVCFFLFVFLCMVMRTRVFESQVFFFDVEHPSNSIVKKTIVVFGRSVPDVLVENNEKSILHELSPSRYHSAGARLASIFAIVCAFFILSFFNMFSGFAILTAICLFFSIFGSLFLKQLWWLVFVAAGVGLWSFHKIDFEQSPEYLLLVMAVVGTLIAASQYLRAIELSKINEMSKASENPKNDWRIWKNAIWMSALFVLSVWGAQAWIPHRNPDPDTMFPPPPPKLISPKLSRSLAERMAGLEGRFGGGSAQGGGGSAQGGGGSDVPSPEPLAAKNDETATTPGTTGKTNGETANSSIGRAGQQGNTGTSSSHPSENSRAGQSSGQSSGQSPSQQPGADLTQKKEERIKHWQNLLERIFANLKGAIVVVAIVIAAVVLLLFLKEKSEDQDSKKRLKHQMLEEEDRVRLKRIFQLIQSRKIGGRQEVIETYNAVLEVLDTAQYARDPWNPVEEYSVDIAKQIRPIGTEFQSLTETFSDVLYGEKEIEQPRLEEFRQNVTGILQYFRL